MGATDGQDYSQANRLKYKADENLWEALYALNRVLGEFIAPEDPKLVAARDTVWAILQARNPALKD